MNNSILENNNLSGLLIRDMRWRITTAGPSPHNNERTELFLLGCNKAMSGNPCKGCFNSSTWDNSKAEFSHDPIKVAELINKHAPNKYITIGGGEPTDQIDNLIILCKELKKYNFNILVYTWRELKHTVAFESPFREKMLELYKHIDIIIDGEYKEEERLYQENNDDGFYSSIGSGNQIIWKKLELGFTGYKMKDLNYISYHDEVLCFHLKDMVIPEIMQL